MHRRQLQQRCTAESTARGSRAGGGSGLVARVRESALFVAQHVERLGQEKQGSQRIYEEQGRLGGDGGGRDPSSRLWFRMSKNNPGTQARQIYRTKAQYNERRPNQEPGKNKTGGEMCRSRNLTRTRLRCAEPESPEEPNLCAPKREDAARMGGARSLRFCPALPRSGACSTCLVERAMAEGKEEEEEGRKREVSSINGLPFYSSAR